MPWWSSRKQTSAEGGGDGGGADADAAGPIITSPGDRLRPVTFRDMAFQPMDDTYWVESVTVTCFLEDGSFVLYSFVITSVPFSKHKAAVNLKVNPADGSPAVYYQQMLPVGKIEWSEDKTSATFPDGSFFRYDDEHKRFVCTTMNDHQASTERLFKGAAHVTLTFEAEVKTGMQVGCR
jgi:hypothetical protein